MSLMQDSSDKWQRLLLQANTQVLAVMKVIGLGARLHPMIHSHHRPGILQDWGIIVRNLEPHQGGVRGMMPWVKLSFKYLALQFLSVSSKLSSLAVSTNLPSPSTMVVLTQLNMWATLTKEWLFIPRIKLWYVRFSPQALVHWQWGGLTVLRRGRYILLRSWPRPLRKDSWPVIKSPDLWTL